MESTKQTQKNAKEPSVGLAIKGLMSAEPSSNCRAKGISSTSAPAGWNPNPPATFAPNSGCCCCCSSCGGCGCWGWCCRASACSESMIGAGTNPRIHRKIEGGRRPATGSAIDRIPGRIEEGKVRSDSGRFGPPERQILRSRVPLWLRFYRCFPLPRSFPSPSIPVGS